MLLPSRWVVERDFISERLCPTSRFRRLVKDYERLPIVLEELHSVAFACLFLGQAIGIWGASIGPDSLVSQPLWRLDVELHPN